MIKNYDDFLYYLEEDKKMLNITRKRPRLIGDEVWLFQIYLRKVEYYLNCGNTVVDQILLKIYKFRKYKMMLKLGFSIPNNVFGPGLSISHAGTIVVNSKAKIGANCRIHNCVVIGSAPIIGDNCYIGPGVKIFGKINIPDNVKIGANCVVNKSIKNPDSTVVGIPFKELIKNTSKE
jgi:serine O-acetyltransferase